MSSSKSIHEQLSLNIERRISISNSRISLNYCTEKAENPKELSSSCIQLKSQSLRTCLTEIKKESNDISSITDQSIDSERLYDFARTSENLFLNSDPQLCENEDIFEGFLDLDFIKNTNNNEKTLSKTLNHVDDTQEVDLDGLHTQVNAKKSLYHQTKKDFYSRDSNFEVIVVNSIKNHNKANKVIKLDNIKKKIDSKLDTNNLKNKEKINYTKKITMRKNNKCTSKNTLSTQSKSDKTVNMYTNTHTNNKFINKPVKQSKIDYKLKSKKRNINIIQNINQNSIVENNRNIINLQPHNFLTSFPTNTSCFYNFNNNNQINSMNKTYNNKAYLNNNSNLNLNHTLKNYNQNNQNPQNNSTYINNFNNVPNYDWDIMNINNKNNNINNYANVEKNNSIASNINSNRQYNFQAPNNFIIVNQPQQYNNIPVSSLFYCPQASSIYYQNFNNQLGYY